MIRPAVAAGLFYPQDPAQLAETVDALLADARVEPGARLRAVVAPHAAYRYSGAVAASALALLPPSARVLVLGPSHFVPLHGIAVSGADRWRTPLGDIAVAADLRETALAAGAVVDDRPHALDHALEVVLPFLQRRCSEALEILPVAVGRAPPDVAAAVFDVDALAVVSTDLSHYRPREAARALDEATADAVLRRDAGAIGEGAACGVHALRTVVEHARRRELDARLLDLRTSADAGGDPGSVVGYGAFAFFGSG